jgi:hypothetical protein
VSARGSSSASPYFLRFTYTGGSMIPRAAQRSSVRVETPCRRALSLQDSRRLERFGFFLSQSPTCLGDDDAKAASRVTFTVSGQAMSRLAVVELNATNPKTFGIGSVDSSTPGKWGFDHLSKRTGIEDSSGPEIPTAKKRPFHRDYLGGVGSQNGVLPPRTPPARFNRP